MLDNFWKYQRHGFSKIASFSQGTWASPVSYTHIISYYLKMAYNIQSFSELNIKRDLEIGSSIIITVSLLKVEKFVY